MPGHPLKDPALRKARALQMVALRIRGRSYKQIAAEFNVSENTVERTLDYAKRAGLVAQFEDQILQELVPAAIENFKTAMQNGDTQVALEVFKGTGLLLRPQEKAKAPTVTEGDGDEDLEVYIRRIRGGTRDVPTVTASPVPTGHLPPAAPDREAVVEAEVLPAGSEAGLPRAAGSPDDPAGA